MTINEFITKSNLIHGDKYKYINLPDKILSNDNITLSYNDETYTQKVCKHLMGRCPEKNTPRKSLEEFIKESKLIHGDKYDYSLVEYDNSFKKVKIIYEGIIYEQAPSQHLSGKCPEFNMNLESFIKRSINKWGIGVYDYSLVEYKNCKEKVKIIHIETNNVFLQTPEKHLIYRPEKKIIDNFEKMQTFIKKASILYNNKYNYDKTYYSNISKKCKIVCPIHGEFEQTPKKHLEGNGCIKCINLNKKKELVENKERTTKFIKLSIEKWGDKYDYSKVKYINSRTKVIIIYDDIEYLQLPSNHLKYPVERYMDEKIFLIKAKRKWGDKYDYSLVEYISTHEKIKIIYNDRIYEQLPSNHLRYAPENLNSTTLDEFINYSNQIHNNKYDYNKSIYLTGLIPMIITCPEHGDFEQKPSIHLRGSGCKKCKESSGESLIRKFLIHNNIYYKNEYKFDDCINIQHLKFDFYIPSMNVCIEYDGIQHFIPIDFFGGYKEFDDTKNRDDIKNKYCLSKGIKIIRIPYYDKNNINNILIKELNIDSNILSDYLFVDTIRKNKITKNKIIKKPNIIPFDGVVKCKDDFIKKSKHIWGSDVYDYSLVEYKNINTKIKLICKENGRIYEQTPKLHFKSAPECSNFSYNIIDFLEDSYKIHGELYDYSDVLYVNNRTNVNINCKKHGIFEQTPNQHTSGKGCPICSIGYCPREYNKRYTKDEFIAESIRIWGDEYDYSLIDFVDMRTKVKILYNNKIYLQTPNKHLRYQPTEIFKQPHNYL